MSDVGVVPPPALFAEWQQHDLDEPADMDLIYAGVRGFVNRNTVDGVLQFDPDGFNYNLTAIPERLSKPEEPGVIVRFQSMDEFKEIHKAASEYEEALETKDVDDFNKEENLYRAWPILSVPEEDNVTQWLILVSPSQDMETRIPDIGGCCQLRLVQQGSDKGASTWWTAKRTHNNFAAAGEAKKNWSKLVAFSVTLVHPEEDPDSAFHALVPSDGHQQEHLDNLQLTKDNAVTVGLFFTKSSATFEAEMKSLSKLVKAALAAPETARAVVPDDGKNSLVEDWLEVPPAARPESIPPTVIPKPKNPRTVRAHQVSAFKYLLDFKEPDFTTNMFQIFPHMVNPNRPGSGVPPAIMKKYARMNEHQRQAYVHLLSHMPCGIAMLPGGPGGGKTDWAMTVIGVMQSLSRAKVLYLLDINGPLDDATAKYIRLMRNAGLAKKAIRMRNFGTEMKRSSRLGTMDSRPGGSEEPEVDFSRSFMSLYTQHAAGTAPDPTRTRHQQIIPTLDEAAWQHYDRNRAAFQDLTDAIAANNGSPLHNRALRFEIFLLYSAVLHQADFIATTPCVAASAFSRMFVPHLVVFDEAAHARELSTLIAIANFCPEAGWIFIGDHRQTQPTVKSNNTNPHGRQLATSAMERAHLAGALKHQLLINHRAYGKLERLPSKLIYDAKMVSAIPFMKRFPRWMRFIQDYLQNIAGGRTGPPRLIVHLHGVGQPTKVGTSWYHPQHMAWTMERVLELVRDQRFRSAENESNQGTILLLAPYKAAVTRYQEAIDKLAQAHPSLRIPQRVEARTWDSSQGHEADIVGIDYVREHPTGFMDGMYRFNVGLTRARQGEWHLMHPNMPKAPSFQSTKYLRKLYSACDVGIDGFFEGRIANLTWGQQVCPVPARARNTKTPAAAAAHATADAPTEAIQPAPNDDAPDTEEEEKAASSNDEQSPGLPTESPSTVYTHSPSVHSPISLTPDMPVRGDTAANFPDEVCPPSPPSPLSPFDHVIW